MAVYYVHADQLATPRAVTRPSDDAIVWRWDHADPFGANPANENPGGLGNFAYNLRFPGQQYDAENGTHYNYFRDYDPGVGRYLQSDPILRPGFHVNPLDARMAISNLVILFPALAGTYNYSFAQPLQLADERGLFSLVDFLKCAYYGSKLGEFKNECVKECPSDNEGYIKWVQQYGGAGFDDAVRACMCKKAGAELCRQFVEACVGAPYSGKPPTMRWPRVPGG